MSNLPPILIAEPGPSHTLVVRFSRSNLADHEVTSEFQRKLAEWIGSGSRRILISFAGVAFMSSAMLSELLVVRSSLAKHDGQLRLSCLSPNLAEVFKITNLASLFKIHPGEAEAIQSFQ